MKFAGQVMSERYDDMVIVIVFSEVDRQTSYYSGSLMQATGIIRCLSIYKCLKEDDFIVINETSFDYMRNPVSYI